MFCCVLGNTALLSYCVCILNMQLKNHKSGKPHKEEVVDVVMVSHMHTGPTLSFSQAAIETLRD